MNRRFDEKNQVLVVDIPMRLKKRGGRRCIIVPERLQTAETEHDYSESLALSITRAHRWKELIDSGRFSSISELAQSIGLDVSYAARLYRLTLLAPDIIEAILEGNEPDGLSLRVLAKPISLDWKEQRKLLGFADGSEGRITRDTIQSTISFVHVGRSNGTTQSPTGAAFARSGSADRS